MARRVRWPRAAPVDMALTAHKLELACGPADAPRRPTVRVAIASQDGKCLNAHFGFARKLMVYEVSARSHRLVRAIQFSDAELDVAPEGEKIAAKVAALGGCQLLYVLAIGPPAAARVIEAAIFPIKLAEPEPIASVIKRVQALMTEHPAWLGKILETHDCRKEGFETHDDARSDKRDPRDCSARAPLS